MTNPEKDAGGKIVIYGAGGLGREVLQLLRLLGGYEILGFADDGVEAGTVRNDAAVLGGIDCLDALREPFSLVFGFADPSRKHRAYGRLKANPLISFPVIAHPSAQIGDYTEIGEGTLITANCFISTNARIGKCVFLNWAVTVGHDAVVGDFSSVMPMSAIAGFVEIGERNMIGAQSAIRQGLATGPDCTVGMGGIVVKDVPGGRTVVGNPARER